MAIKYGLPLVSLRDRFVDTVNLIADFALADPRDMRPLVAHYHVGLGKLSRRARKREQAQEHLTTATTMYREMGMTYWLQKAEGEVTKLGS